MWTDERQNRVRRALGVFMRAGDSAAIDRHLATLNLAELSCDDMLTYLRTLKTVAPELSQYWLFFARVRDALSFRGHLRGDTFKGCLPAKKEEAPPAVIHNRYPEPRYAGRGSELPAPLLS